MFVPLAVAGDLFLASLEKRSVVSLVEWRDWMNIQALSHYWAGRCTAMMFPGLFILT